MSRMYYAMLGSLICICLVEPVAARTVQPPLSFSEEQKLVHRLIASNEAIDQRRLAERLASGLIASEDNPLRRPDRDGAIIAYRRAISAGDVSATTVIALSRLLLRQDERSGMEVLRPRLRSLVLQGHGDAAYLLALDAAQGGKLSSGELRSKLEAAAITGSISATLDLATTGNISGGTTALAAVDMLRERAQSGSGAASFALYQIHRRAILVERSPFEAMKWLTMAVEQGHVQATERLAEHLLRGMDIGRDPPRAAALLRQAAEAGSGSAAMQLGRYSGPGSQTGVSTEEGRIWLRRAAEIGIRGAAVEISSIDLGQALQTDASPARIAGMVEAALLPIAQDPEALSDLADRHWKTANSRIIAPLLMPLLKEQALSGSAAAGMAYNGWLQANGETLPLDVAAALVKSLRNGSRDDADFANFTIASMALDGRFPASIVSASEATRLLMQAADAGIGWAMWRLGKLYMHGDQLARSPTFAKRWLAAAKAQSIERAGWDLADLQLRDRDQSERNQGERFYLQKLDEGDPRAGLALVEYRLSTGDLDMQTLAQAQQAIKEPGDIISLASLLFRSGGQANAALGHALLDTLDEAELDDKALVSCGRLLVSMAGSDHVRERGLKLVKKASDAGSVTGKTMLAGIYLSSAVYRDRQEQGVALLNEVVTDHPYDQDARLLLSRAYRGGIGTERDMAKAARLLDAVRAEGEYRSPKATFMSASDTAFVMGGAASEASALLIMQAARGSAAAERTAGGFDLSGLDRMIRPDAAAGRFYAAARRGDREAMAALGHLLLNGHGVSKSRGEGLAWLARASEAGSAEAMYDLSRFHASAPASSDGQAEALHWLRRAADRNHPQATYQLGLAYLEGVGVPRNDAQAEGWFERSASAGNSLAVRTLETLQLQAVKHPSSGLAEVSHD